ncbi:MAG: UvrD-helicase domain-containing protein [Acidobacteria bacterium]|nr:UvrD-helicase domain-containing protein [Acidobacteriota bacterium]
MEFIADLHIHSRFSRATARDLDLPGLHAAAQRKGITVLATGDFTHPEWFGEIESQLVPAEPGLFRLRDELARAADDAVPAACRGPVRFMLATEISNIYKKEGRTRKNHNLVYVPDLDTARRLNTRLDDIGNIRSDGRPILGLDARDLLDIVLETSTDSFLIPAHIWTPWFSVLGSKSGFDSVVECFGDLTPHIFAAETGLSSDPAMNWRVSGLDAFTLVANSDAHSSGNLGRNANIFNTELSFAGVREAMRSGDPAAFIATIDLYPEEGKYHMDGHRKCAFWCHPRETRRHQGLCPRCGKPLTIGVYHRVEELADRPEGYQPAAVHPSCHIIPLPEILAELCRVGPQSRKVRQVYDAVLERLGPELAILRSRSTQELAGARIPLLDEAIGRMRRGEIHIQPGYDGEYGTIRVFTPDERQRLSAQGILFALPRTAPAAPRPPMPEPEPDVPPHSPRPAPEKSAPTIPRGAPAAGPTDLLAGLDEAQRQAVTYRGGPMLIMAGPGSGKTRTITCRIAHLIRRGDARPGDILALTFTRQAADELQDRLRALLPPGTPVPFAGTFHALGYRIWQEQHPDHCFTILDDAARRTLVKILLNRYQEKGTVPASLRRPDDLVTRFTRAKESLLDHPARNVAPDRVQIPTTFAATARLLPGMADFVTPTAPPETGTWTSSSQDRPSTDRPAASPFEGTADEIHCCRTLFAEYQAILSAQGLLDFEDLIVKPAGLLDGEAAVREAYRQRYPYVFVDEYQDIDHAQYRLLRALAPPKGQICAIGDPDQAIYGFRGADVRHVLRFREDYAPVRIITLTCNYRSSRTILAASRQVMRTATLHDPDYRLVSEIEGFPVIAVWAQTTAQAEVVAIGRTIERLVGGTGLEAIDSGKVDGHAAEAGRSFADFAVLARTRQQLQLIASRLQSAGIPVQLADRAALRHCRHLAALTALLRLLSNSGTWSDLAQVMAIALPAMSVTTRTRLCDRILVQRRSLADLLRPEDDADWTGLRPSARRQWIELRRWLADLAGEMTTLAGVRVKIEYLLNRLPVLHPPVDNAPAQTSHRKYIALADRCGDRPADFFQALSLRHETDDCDRTVEKVALLTMHAAKGLEFPVVFIAGCEDGYIPYRRSPDQAPDATEERRLFYVALTRAREQLFLTWARRRNIHGRTEPRHPSPFIRDIEAALLQHNTTGRPSSAGNAARQKRLF